MGVPLYYFSILICLKISVIKKLKEIKHKNGSPKYEIITLRNTPWRAAWKNLFYAHQSSNFHSAAYCVTFNKKLDFTEPLSST